MQKHWKLLSILHIRAKWSVFGCWASHVIRAKNSKQDITPWIHIKPKVLEKETKKIFKKKVFEEF
jgi:hypothetical protein